ncbi:TLC domain-containing protein 2-like [Dendronephthya gigantea]|uniref:TLC domain-containing protein 2-like n=1 Tax=Dendronephthya gigantea TaxID=151771 RepID=UPI001069F074|nr:TLC domain-containing protein 2-like [Dendronephthya gigantea]
MRICEYTFIYSAFEILRSKLWIMEEIIVSQGWLYVSVISALSFQAVNKSVALVLPAPRKFQDQWKKVWLWENICTSFVHSFLSALLTVYSIYKTPSMLKDMIDSWNILAYYTLALSIGYFIYDFINLIINDREKGLCIMIHHVLVIFIFYITVSNKKYIPFALCALLMEINSVFLHTRRLMHMSDINPKGLAFRMNCILLTTTFVIFRLILCAWMIHFFVMNGHTVSQLHLGFGIFGLCIVIPQNLLLLNQVWLSDAKRNTQLSQAEKEKLAVRDNNANNLNGLEKLKHFLQMTIARSAE